MKILKIAPANGNCKKLGCLSVKISLCKPDDLIVGGIIEASPAAGLATSLHLNLGDYVATRRSGESWLRYLRGPTSELVASKSPTIFKESYRTIAAHNVSQYA